MCFGSSVPQDNSAQVAAQSEATREANVTAGQQNIDSAFSQYDDPYYSGITQNYENYYDPQLSTQYNNALNSLTMQLGQQGILSSTEGDRQLALLKQTNDTEQQTIAQQALDAANTAKQQVAQEKQTLYNQNNTAADPSAAATQAASAAGSVVTPPNLSPLGNAFSGLLGQGTNALALQAGGTPGVNYGNVVPSNNAALGPTAGTVS